MTTHSSKRSRPNSPQPNAVASTCTSTASRPKKASKYASLDGSYKSWPPLQGEKTPATPPELPLQAKEEPGPVQQDVEEDEEVNEPGEDENEGPQPDDDAPEAQNLGVWEDEVEGEMDVYYAALGIDEVQPPRLEGPAPPVVRLSMKYQQGALRITRTPGRDDGGPAERNTIRLGQILQPQGIVTAFISSFFYVERDLFPHLPIYGPHSLRDAPIYINSDINSSPHLGSVIFNTPSLSDIAARLSKRTDPPTGPKKPNNAELERIIPGLINFYSSLYPANFHPIFTSLQMPHSKIALVVYVGFIRLLISSANFMRLDIEAGDNHFFIVDFPLLATSTTSSRHSESESETIILAHLLHLGCPSHFITKIRGKYDWSVLSSAGIRIITSQPSTFSNSPSNNNLSTHGIFRLATIAKEMMKDVSKEERESTRLEICSASIGGLLDNRWIRQWLFLARGGTRRGLAALEEEEEERDEKCRGISIVFPSVRNVRSWSQRIQEVCNGIGHHFKWSSSSPLLRSLFHQFHSKDAGSPFHLKSYLLFSPPPSPLPSSAPPPASAPSPPPHYLIIGSANFTAAAWGRTTYNVKKDITTLSIRNSECGVVIPGRSLMRLLEEGTESWEEIVPYVRPVGEREKELRYGVGDRPFNHQSWASRG